MSLVGAIRGNNKKPKAPTRAALDEMAVRFKEIGEEQARLKAEKDKLRQDLTSAMEAAKIGAVQVDQTRDVALVPDNGKVNVSRKLLIAHFGPQGKKFWDSLPTKDKKYLRVVERDEESE